MISEVQQFSPTLAGTVGPQQFISNRNVNHWKVANGSVSLASMSYDALNYLSEDETTIINVQYSNLKLLNI